jgi:hypothetical protein
MGLYASQLNGDTVYLASRTQVRIPLPQQPFNPPGEKFHARSSASGWVF